MKGTTWIRRRGTQRKWQENQKGRVTGARQHFPKPPSTSPEELLPLSCQESVIPPDFFFKSETFFSKYLGETLFAVSVWGLWDRILTEDSKLCLFLHACPTHCLCSPIGIGAGSWCPHVSGPQGADGEGRPQKLLCPGLTAPPAAPGKREGERGNDV